MNKLSKMLLGIIVVLLIALGIMTYYYLQMRGAYSSAANEMVQMVQKLEETEAKENRSEENVKIEIIKDSVTSSGITITITDRNENPYAWGEEYKIQVKENDTWKEVKPVTEISFNEIAFKLDGNGQIKEKIDWSKFYGTLPKGTYKIIKPIDTSLQSIYFDSDEFEIK